ncbi:hypothetical protein FH972_021782 [Carpinus fangiana]|uniref:Uncharacterized protein n=1 Tax=Carpinus fangiana TaxID=176857 RepID=A0A5N6KQP1_9ROSI|nr:hypothetical protein FH972_021782 [Carpinus fangiana]
MPSINFPSNSTPPDLSAGSFTITAPPNCDTWRSPPSANRFTAPIAYQALPLSQFASATVTISAPWKTLYDQGGLILVLPATAEAAHDAPGTTSRRWIKAGIEFVDGKPMFSVVATDRWSDWSLVPLSASSIAAAGGAQVTVTFRRDGGHGPGPAKLWVYLGDAEGGEQRVRKIPWVFEGEDGEAWIGAYAAKPNHDEGGGDAGIEVSFSGNGIVEVLVNIGNDDGSKARVNTVELGGDVVGEDIGVLLELLQVGQDEGAAGEAGEDGLVKGGLLADDGVEGGVDAGLQVQDGLSNGVRAVIAEGRGCLGVLAGLDDQVVELDGLGLDDQSLDCLAGAAGEGGDGRVDGGQLLADLGNVGNDGLVVGSGQGGGDDREGGGGAEELHVDTGAALEARGTRGWAGAHQATTIKQRDSLIASQAARSAKAQTCTSSVDPPRTLCTGSRVIDRTVSKSSGTPSSGSPLAGAGDGRNARLSWR